MPPTVRSIRRLVALVAFAALAAADAPRANHFILPCEAACDAARWELTGSLNVARSGHTATRLEDGRVLVAGGRGAGGPLASAELYDPQTGTWTLTGAMSMPRVSHTATLLADGKVLVVGGDTSPAPPDFGRTASAELYDPATGQWQPTGAMSSPHSWHTATRLPDGRVLVAGGYSQDTLPSAELYDPVAGVWSPAAPLNTGRYGHSATLLEDGRVLVTAGSNDGDLTSTLCDAELYDATADAWSTVPGCIDGSVDHSATRLPGGQVLVAGGYAGGIGGGPVLADAFLFDPVSATWSRTASLAAARYDHAAALLPSGEVLVAGGTVLVSSYPTLQYVTLASSERFDPITATWSRGPDLHVARSGHTATLLKDGRVLVAGGSVSGSDYPSIPLASAEVYGASAAPAGVHGRRFAQGVGQ